MHRPRPFDELFCDEFLRYGAKGVKADENERSGDDCGDEAKMHIDLREPIVRGEYQRAENRDTKGCVEGVGVEKLEFIVKFRAINGHLFVK